MMSYVVRQAENEHFILKIVQDDDARSPRQDFDNLGTMVCFHHRYNLGDSHSYSDPRHFLESLAMELAELEEEVLEEMSMDELMDTIEEHVVMLPLYLYDHSGITMRTSPFSCPWDSGQVGYIYVPVKDLEKEGLTLQQAEDILEAEVKTYDQYLTGDIYGYILETHEGEHIDSCWGFYGLDHILSELKGELSEEYHDLIEQLV